VGLNWMFRVNHRVVGLVGNAMQKFFRQTGFTLIEILVALTVFAITSSTLITGMTRHVAQSTALRDKTFAYWIAENEMAQLRLQETYTEESLSGSKSRSQSQSGSEDRFPELGSQYKEIVMAELDWEVEIQVSSTKNQDIRQIAVMVSRSDQAGGGPVFTLDGFIGRY